MWRSQLVIAIAKQGIAPNRGIIPQLKATINIACLIFAASAWQNI
ncbi:MAG: hypothetical protein ACR9NN_01195 [Nostochopsis sp.]